MRVVKYFLIFILVFLTGCASKPDIKFMRYTDTPYPATNSVEVLRVKPIEKEYVELGELKLRLKKSTEEDAILYMKEEAMAIGADAIVILGEQDDGAIAVPISSGYGYPMYASVDRRYLIVLAIRYTNTDK